jgi:RNA polymerase sigma factor (sigma-70 family)
LSSSIPFPIEFSARLRAGEPAICRLIFIRLWPVALRAAGHVLRQRVDAEDAAATALTELIKRPDLPESWPALEAYIAVIARRRAISLLREHTALKRGGGTVLPLDHAAEIPAATVARHALDIGVALNQLDPQRRRLVEEHFLDGLTSEELARRHQLKPSTIRSHLHRAVRSLRLWMKSDEVETKAAPSATE